MRSAPDLRGTADRARRVPRRDDTLLHAVVMPVSIYLAGQAIAVGMLAVLCFSRGISAIGRLTAWDGRRFLDIAASGYTWSSHSSAGNPPAFFPGYPALVAGLHILTGLPLPAAAIGLSLVCGLVFACAIPQLVRQIPGMDRRAELVAVALVATSPMSIVLSMAYSEATFCALASWSLVAALKGRWWFACLFAFPAGLVRISGFALAAAFATVATAAAIRNRHRFKAAVVAALRPAATAVVAAAGTAGWIIGSGIVMGSPTAWFTLENTGWRGHWDFGVATAQFLFRTVTTAPTVFGLLTAAVLVTACVLVACTFRQAQPILLLAYGTAAVAEVVGSADLVDSRMRLLIPAFTILFPAAAWLSRMRRSSTILAAIAIAAAGSWIGAYSLAIWPHAI